MLGEEVQGGWEVRLVGRRWCEVERKQCVINGLRSLVWILICCGRPALTWGTGSADPRLSCFVYAVAVSVRHVRTDASYSICKA